MPLVPPRLWVSPLTRAYEAEDHRAAGHALLAGIPLAALAFALAVLGRLDPLTGAMCVALFGFIGWATAFEALIWDRFGAGSLYMAWMRSNSRAWWRRIGLSSRSSPARASAWLERHARDPGLTADRAVVSALLGRSVQAHADIELLGDASPADRWAKGRLQAVIGGIDGSGQAQLDQLRRLVAELDDPRERILGEADLIGFEIGALVDAGGDWKRELRHAVERANKSMVAAGLEAWQFRLRTRDRYANLAGGLTLAAVAALFIAVAVTWEA